MPDTLPAGYKLDASPSGLAIKHLEAIHEGLKGEAIYWGRERDLATFRRQVERAWSTPTVVKVLEDGREELAGFCRVVSDGEAFGYLDDVFILPAHQGKGLSRFIVDEAIHHSGRGEGKESGTWYWFLWSNNAQGLYQKPEFKFRPCTVPRALERYPADWKPVEPKGGKL